MRHKLLKCLIYNLERIFLQIVKLHIRIYHLLNDKLLSESQKFKGQKSKSGFFIKNFGCNTIKLHYLDVIFRVLQNTVTI